MGGYTKEEAFRKIAAARTIYAGHTKDWHIWPESEKSNKNAEKLWEAHEFAGKVADGLIASLRPNAGVAASSGLQPAARCQVPTKSTKSTTAWGTGSNQSPIDLTRSTTKSSAPADPAYPALQESTAKKTRRLVTSSEAEKMLGEPKPTMKSPSAMVHQHASMTGVGKQVIESQQPAPEAPIAVSVAACSQSGTKFVGIPPVIQAKNVAVVSRVTASIRSLSVDDAKSKAAVRAAVRAAVFQRESDEEVQSGGDGSAVDGLQPVDAGSAAVGLQPADDAQKPAGDKKTDRFRLRRKLGELGFA